MIFSTLSKAWSEVPEKVQHLKSLVALVRVYQELEALRCAETERSTLVEVR
jgi:hypothetical protein